MHMFGIIIMLFMMNQPYFKGLLHGEASRKAQILRKNNILVEPLV